MIDNLRFIELYLQNEYIETVYERYKEIIKAIEAYCNEKNVKKIKKATAQSLLKHDVAIAYLDGKLLVVRNAMIAFDINISHRNLLIDVGKSCEEKLRDFIDEPVCISEIIGL